MMTDTIKIFCSYSYKDEEFYKCLEAHLGALRRQGYINLWSDRTIDARSTREDKDAGYLNKADLILLLISSDFFGSEVEMNRALERHEREGTPIIPIIVRPCSWKNTPLAQFNILPKSHVPVIEWEDPEEAFCDIAKELRYFVANLNINEWRDKGNKLYRKEKYKDALLFYEKILHLKSNLAVSIELGNVLNDLQQYEEALHVYDICLQVAQTNKSPLETKNDIDEYEYKEALQIYELVFQRNVPRRLDFTLQGMAQEDIPHTVNQSSLEQLNQAIQRHPTNPFLYHLKGNLLFVLEQYTEALRAYEEALQLHLEFDILRQYLSATLERIGQQEYKKLDVLARRDLQKVHKLRDEHNGDVKL